MENPALDPAAEYSPGQPLPASGQFESQCREAWDICEIQLSYGRLLDVLTKLGFVLLLVTFALYVFGILSNSVPWQSLPRCWSLPLSQYLAMTHTPQGWAWLWELHQGDLLNLLPIAFLSGIAIVCTLSVALKFFRSREPLQGIIAVLEVIVLLAAASGLLRV